MKQLLYFNHNILKQPTYAQLPGAERFSKFFNIFVSASVPIDRSGTFTLPLSMKSLFPLPSMRPFSNTYAEICNARAKELLDRLEKLACPMYIFWSGGIDSTLVLVSLLKQATVEQKKRFVVVLSEGSIAENPNFYRDHLRGKLRMESSEMFPHFIGRDIFIVNGELNDQIFGAELSHQLMKRFGDPFIHKKFDRDAFLSFFTEKLDDEQLANWYVDLFAQLAAASPVELLTNHDIIWWFNFAAHWQGVFMRVLLFTAKRNKDLITQAYVSERYNPFYGTEEFQLWSMNNLDKKIKDTWTTYKWPAKDIIYDYTKDAEYRDNKTKKGSMFSVFFHNTPFECMDDSFRLMNNCNVNDFLNPNNSFR